MDGFGLVLLFWSAWHLHNRHSTHVGWHFLCLVVPTIVPTFSRTWSSGRLSSLSRDEHVKFICYTCGTNGTNGTNIRASWAIGPGSAHKSNGPRHDQRPLWPGPGARHLVMISLVLVIVLVLRYHPLPYLGQ